MADKDDIREGKDFGIGIPQVTAVADVLRGEASVPTETYRWCEEEARTGVAAVRSRDACLVHDGH